MMLKLIDIEEWLIEHRCEYQELKAQEFPPIGHPVYWMYHHLSDFISYFKYKQSCDKALLDLKGIDLLDSAKLGSWTKAYKKLGSHDLLMFEVYYNRWEERVSETQIKIHEGLYTERKPFTSILCFCQVFHYLYWDVAICEVVPPKENKQQIKHALKRMLLDFNPESTT